MSEKMNEKIKEKKSVIIAVLILVAIVIIGTTVGITQFKEQQAASGGNVLTEGQQTDTQGESENIKSEQVKEEAVNAASENKTESKTAGKDSENEAKNDGTKSAEKSEEKAETAETAEAVDKKPAFLYFVSESDADYEKAVKVFEELKKEYEDKVDFELKNVTEDPSLLENFALVNGNTPMLIMDGKEGITGFSMKMTDKKTLEEEIKKALN